MVTKESLYNQEQTSHEINYNSIVITSSRGKQCQSKSKHVGRFNTMARAGFYTSGKQDTKIIIVVVVAVILINANERKTSCTNLVYDFLRLIC